MWHSIVLLHIIAAVMGLLSGYLAIVLKKGSGPHNASGTIFVVSMLIMSSSAAFLASFLKPNRLNFFVSLLTFYLVATAWRAGRQREGRLGWFDAGALVFIVLVGIGTVASGLGAAGSESGQKDGMPAAGYFIFGSAALLCATSDLRMLGRGSLVGGRRIARHLWRMSSALLIATLSFFPGQARQLPEWLRETPLLYLPHLVLVGSMTYWMFRIRKRVKQERAAGARSHPAPNKEAAAQTGLAA